jgi:hypothetical protein
MGLFLLRGEAPVHTLYTRPPAWHISRGRGVGKPRLTLHFSFLSYDSLESLQMIRLLHREIARAQDDGVSLLQFAPLTPNNERELR